MSARWISASGVTMCRSMRSVSIVSRWIPVLGLCAAVGLSACGHAADSRPTASATVTTPSQGSGTSTQYTPPAATPSGASIPTAPGQEQTHPRIIPRRGGGLTVFTLELTSRAQLGLHGVLSISYQVEIAGPRALECAVANPPGIRRGSVGERIRLLLRPGPAGWCPGGYSATVMIERGPHCRGSQRCPEIRSERLAVGRVAWRVAKTPKPV